MRPLPALPLDRSTAAQCCVAAAVPSGFNSHRYDSSLPWVSGKTVFLDLTILDPF